MKALVTVSFGTTHADTREATIERVREDLERAFSGYDSFEAFTSGRIRNILKERGEKVDSPEEILEKLSPVYDEVLLVSTHLLDGIEYAKLAASAARYREHFKSLTLTDPLLKREEDVLRMAELLEEEFAPYWRDPETFVLLMGHGSQSEGSAVYDALNAKLSDVPVEIACVEGEPGLTRALEKIARSGRRRLVLAPFMLVAGEHAKVDMENTWKSALTARGYRVETLHRGLGEYPWFREFLIERIL